MTEAPLSGAVTPSEARHEAIVRKIGGKKSWDGAFDEPMTKDEVLAAAKPFLA